jgi:hypothetical protein
MTRLMRILATMVAVLLAGYFVVYSFRTLDWVALRQTATSVETVTALLGASVLYACIVPVTGWAWSKLLAARGEFWRARDLGVILGLAQLAKYVPGNVAQHAARAAMSARRGIGLSSLVSSVTQETVMTAAASVGVGLIALVASGRGIAAIRGDHAQMLAIAGLAVVTGVIAFSIVRKHKAKAWTGPLGRFFVALTTLPSPKACLMALTAYASNYLIIGLGLWLVARSLDGSGSLSYFLVTAAFSLSWLLGFMTPGAPAGLGTREGIMLLLLHGAGSAEMLTMFVLLARLVTMLGDVLCFLGAGALRWRIGRSGWGMREGAD